MDLHDDLGYILGLRLPICSVGMVISAYRMDVSMLHELKPCGRARSYCYQSGCQGMARGGWGHMPLLGVKGSRCSLNPGAYSPAPQPLRVGKAALPA